MILGLGNTIPSDSVRQGLGGGGGSFDNTYSLAFDGVDDEVGVSEVVYSSDFTFSFWVKPASFTNAFVFGDINSNGSFLRLYNSTQIHFKFGGSKYTFTESAGNDLVLNSWQHIMIIRDSSNLLHWPHSAIFH